MYDFHYGAVKTKYEEKATLLFTDTDSLCYTIETEDVYADMLANENEFDFSNYPNYSAVNKKVIGKMKVSWWISKIKFIIYVHNSINIQIH